MQLVFKVWALGFYIDPWRKGMALIILSVFFFLKSKVKEGSKGMMVMMMMERRREG